MTLIDDYLAEQEKFENKYGKNTIVLMQVGHFYEAYGVDNEFEKSNGENMSKLADIMNIQMTRKNKSIVENNRHNPLMIGVNIYSIDKYIQILLNANYTIVLISQTSEPPYVKREVTNIFSPGTNIEYNSKGNTNNLVSIYIEKIKNNILFVGASSIDLSTGKNVVFETHSEANDKNYAYDELFRFIQVYDPKELIIVKKNLEDTSDDKLSNYLELNNRVVHFKKDNQIQSSYFNISYQKQFLERIFVNHGMLSVIEYLNLENRPFALISYVLLLDFAYEHNSNIIRKINQPELMDNTKYLCLANNTINQLNLVDHSSQNVNCQYSSLFSVLNSTSTNIGKRYLRDNLLNPIVNIDELKKRYEIIDILMKDGIYKIYDDYLRKITDLEKLHRKMALGLLQPADFSSMDISYDNVLKMFELDYLPSLMPSEVEISKFKEFISDYKKIFNMNEIVKYHVDKINGSFFNEGQNPKIDSCQENINNYMEGFQKIANILGNNVEMKNDKYSKMIKIDYTERDGYYLSMTQKRANLLKVNLKKGKLKTINLGACGELKITDINFKNNSKTNTKIECDFLKELSRKIVREKDRIHDLCKNQYLKVINEFDEKYGKYLKAIVKFVGCVDMFKSVAKVSTKFGYVKPEIDEQSEKSYIDFEEIRHPIIERINCDINYVTNDISLGNSKYGLLLFGTNASGKSSLMKAVGLNVIMAQCGFYVSAKRFRFSPYSHIFTRINNNDNIFKGESSFAVEMSELRSILKRANKNSIILGDELCAGTESISALSIFSSSVVKLNERKSTFIFATHLHELCKIPQLQGLDTIQFSHLKVIFDEKTGELIYDRKLADGNGQAIYGLEVCKAMDMDMDFLKLCENIRKDLLGQKQTILENKQSKYNSEVYVHDCVICGKAAEDVHHIKFQCTANENMIIDDYLVKDNKSNLVVLCKNCHNEVHNGKLEIFGYVQTSNGVKLDYKYLEEKQLEEKKNKRKKYSEEQMEIVKKINLENKTSKKEKCIYLAEKHDIKISVITFNKIINNLY